LSIPGQEERNADYLLENGAALKACVLAVLAPGAASTFQQQLIGIVVTT
jgi:hypothetical protein